MKISINNFVKKNSLFFSMLVFSYIGMFGMEKPSSDKYSEGHQFLTEIIGQSMPVSSEPLLAKAGFGQTFDYASLLKPEKDLAQAIYKRRLKSFKRYLFDYVDGYTRPCGSEVEESGSVSAFLSNYLMMGAMLKHTSQSIPFFGGQAILNFIPKQAINKGMFLVPMCDIEGFLLSPLPSTQGVTYACINPMPGGQSGICPIVIRPSGNNLAIAPLPMHTKEGLFAVAPHIEKTSSGKLLIKQKVPVYVITDPEAESISLSLGQLNLKKAPLSEKAEKALSFLASGELSNESRRIISCFVYNLSGELLDEIIKDKEKSKQVPKEEDRKALQDCRVACPEILKLELLQKRLQKCPRNFLDKKTDGTIDFTPNSLSMFSEAHKYLIALNSLAPEYAAIYQRMSEELKALKNKPLKLKPLIEAKKEDVQPIKVLENPVPAKIKYSKRVTKWFKDGFVKNKKQSSINYHATLPTIADPLVIKYGEKSEYDNKTHKGQKDENYTIAGKIIDDETKEESFCLFNVCIDPKGICYHRDCKKCTWEDLPVELKKGGAIEDVEYEEDSSEIDNETGSNPGTVRENNTYISISHPARKCTITLYKKLL